MSSCKALKWAITMDTINPFSRKKTTKLHKWDTDMDSIFILQEISATAVNQLDLITILKEPTTEGPILSSGMSEIWA